MPELTDDNVIEHIKVMDVSAVRNGDCLCLFEGPKGHNLIDVDHRDIEGVV